MISVIVPLYNKAKTIRRTVESILDQPYQDIEVIVVDDGSTDGSAGQISDITDSRLQIVHQLNNGVSSARNNGINIAKGDWLYFIDADDFISAKDGFKIFEEGILEGANIVIANFNKITDEGIKPVCSGVTSNGFIKNPYKMHYFSKCFFQAGSFIVKREIALKALFNTQLRRYEDSEAYFKWIADSSVYIIQDSIFTSDRQYRNLSIPDPEKWAADFAFHMSWDHAFWRNLCQASILQEALYAYPKKRDYLKKKYGYIGKLFLIINRIVRRIQSYII